MTGKPVWLSNDVQRALMNRQEYQGDSINRALERIFVEGDMPSQETIEDLEDRIERLEGMARQ